MAEQADKLRVAQLQRNKRRKGLRGWLGASRMSDVKVNEAGTILPDLSFGTR